MDADRLVEALRNRNPLQRAGDWLSGQFSLDTPQQDLVSPETGGDIALGMIPGVGQAMAMRDIARGIKAEDPVQTGMAAVGLLPFGRLVGALRGPTRELIAGAKAKYFPAEKALQEESMSKMGIDPTTIWGQTGIERTAENKPSFEISDLNSKLMTRSGWSPGQYDTGDMLFHGPARDLIHHPELFKNYPGLAKIPVEMVFDPQMRKPASGSYYNPKFGEQIEIEAQNLDEARSILLHELQHAIQHRERWAGGGNPGAIQRALAQKQAYYGVAPSTSDENVAMRLYLRLMGENQSNTVQNRLMLSPAELAATEPQSTAPFRYEYTLHPNDMDEYLNRLAQRQLMAQKLREQGLMP